MDLISFDQVDLGVNFDNMTVIQEVYMYFFISSVQSLSCVRLFMTPSTAALQVSLSITNHFFLSGVCKLILVWPGLFCTRAFGLGFICLALILTNSLRCGLFGLVFFFFLEFLRLYLQL